MATFFSLEIIINLFYFHYINKVVIQIFSENKNTYINIFSGSNLCHNPRLFIFTFSVLFYTSRSRVCTSRKYNTIRDGTRVTFVHCTFFHIIFRLIRLFIAVGSSALQIPHKNTENRPSTVCYRRPFELSRPFIVIPSCVLSANVSTTLHFTYIRASFTQARVPCLINYLNFDSNWIVAATPFCWNVRWWGRPSVRHLIRLCVEVCRLGVLWFYFSVYIMFQHNCGPYKAFYLMWDLIINFGKFIKILCFVISNGY